MEMSKYVPPKFEVGNLVLLTNKNISDYSDTWIQGWDQTFGVVVEVDWKLERLTVYNYNNADTVLVRPFNEFKLVNKKNKLGKLLFE